MLRDLQPIGGRAQQTTSPPINRHSQHIIPSYSMFESCCIYHENPK